MKKKALALVLALAMSMALIACGQKDTPSNNANDGQSGQTYRAFTQDVPAGYFFRHDVMFWLGFYLTNFDTLRYSALLRAQSMGGSELASIST